MLLGFRAGADTAIRVQERDFAGTRRGWQLPESAGSMAGRVFPDRPFVGRREKPADLVARLDRAVAPVLAAGMIPWWSLKPDVTESINGELDELFTAVGQWVSRLGLRMYGTVHHEPENDAMDAGSNPKHANNVARARNFVRCYTRAYDVMKATAGDLLQMGPVHMSYHWRSGSPTTTAGAVVNAWRVPANRRDFIGLDDYTSNWSLQTGAALRNKANVQRFRTLLEVPDPELLFVERGITRNPRGIKNGAAFQANVLRDDIAWLAELGAHGLMYWNSGGATDDSVFLLGAPGREVFRGQAIAVV